MTCAFFPIGPEHNLVDVNWLKKHLGEEDLVVLCASMGDPSASITEGIPGSYLADLEQDFSRPGPLPHTVPLVEDIRRAFCSRGISDDTTVIVYDANGVVTAPRVWWLGKVIGLKNIAVLDGGLPAWKSAGQLTSAVKISDETTKPGEITATPNPWLVTDIGGVHRALYEGRAVIDARSCGRFFGRDPEPREGLVPGHIPGSHNLPFTDLFNPAGFLRKPHVLLELFSQCRGSAPGVVFSCGSGVTACVNAWAATLLGNEDVAVYDGSWAEWGNPAYGQPVAKGLVSQTAEESTSFGDKATHEVPSHSMSSAKDYPRVSPLRSHIESVLLIVETPVSVELLARATGADEDDVARVVKEIAAEYDSRGMGFEIRESAEGWRLYTRPGNADVVEAFLLDGSQSKLSRAALETLAIVAYRQPCTRAQVSAVRGVNVDGVMRTLSLRGLIRDVDTDPSTGAHLYATTELFLELLGLENLDQLPELAPLLPDVDSIDEEII